MAFLTLALAALSSGPTAPTVDWAAVARRARRPTSTTATTCETTAAMINALVPELLETFNVSSMSVGLICNHSVRVSAGFGVADRENHINASDSTLYQIASNSKLFTSTLLLQLEEEGHVDLDTREPPAGTNPELGSLYPCCLSLILYSTPHVDSGACCESALRVQ